MTQLLDHSVLFANYVRASRTGRFSTRAALEAHQSRQLVRFARKVLTRSPFMHDRTPPHSILCP